MFASVTVLFANITGGTEKTRAKRARKLASSSVGKVPYPKVTPDTHLWAVQGKQ